MFGFLKNISTTELLIIGLILIMLFGAKVVTSLGKTSGETVREIKKIKKTFTDALEDEGDTKSKKGV